MNTRLVVLLTASLLSGYTLAQNSTDFATGNMHFDAKAMDTNGDGMVSKDEFRHYGEVMWTQMAQGNASIPVQQAAQDFARGNMSFDAKAMDTNHDGKITKDEFMKYAEAKFDHMQKDAQGMVRVADISRDFGRGNTQPR
jgi:hypothetical protein